MQMWHVRIDAVKLSESGLVTLMNRHEQIMWTDSYWIIILPEEGFWQRNQSQAALIALFVAIKVFVVS